MKSNSCSPLSTFASLVFVWTVVGFPARIAAEEWPQFRGLRGDGSVSPETAGLAPTEWSRERHALWRTELPGAGASSPVVVPGRIFLTCYSG